MADELNPSDQTQPETPVTRPDEALPPSSEAPSGAALPPTPTSDEPPAQREPEAAPPTELAAPVEATPAAEAEAAEAPPEAAETPPEAAEPPAEAAEPPAEAPAEVPAGEPSPAAPPAAPPPARKPRSRSKAAAPPEVPAEPVPKSDKMDWYILKVQSNREDSIRDGLLRRVAIAGLDYFVGDVIVPTEKVTEFKGGKKRVTKRKLYPGYLVVNMEINDDTWFLVRETPGIGDFTGAAGRPAPMLPHEVARILSKQEEKSEKAPKLAIGFRPGDAVKINEGTFENFEGHVDSIDETNGRVTVMINIFGRSTPVELEYWQIGAV